MRVPHEISARSLLVLFIGLFLGASLGAPPVYGSNGYDTALHDGAWSLELDTSIDTSEDVGIAVKRHMSERSAFRIGVSANLNDSDGKGTSISGGTTEDTEQVNSFYDYRVFLHWVRYASVSDHVAGQFSLGPVVQVFRSYFRFTQDRGLPTFGENENQNSGTSYGVETSLGLEWFFTRRFSLGGHAGLRALMGERESTNINRSGTGPTLTINRSDIDFDTTDLDTVTSRIVLTGYF